ncbi:MAG: hypothetical protein GY724_29305 [Actinomycetia bacterium]|nr:hypothetical protein [Actinomycetes bacterium]MCP4225340.1 hypothetical protein [Actinomycetes bacterium]MCP5035319.1 hypothetical protein [Actinomycetes bacterium]
MVNSGRRIELISNRQSPHRTSYIGLGLLTSLVVGYGPLTDALFGNGSFEGALGRFIACVAVCVFGASSLGHLLDNAPEAEDREDDEIPGASETGPIGAGDPP